MSDPQIVCPKCRTAIRLTDSLAAPLLVKTRKQFEQRLAQQEAGFARRETELRKQKDALARARKAIDDAVAKKAYERAYGDRQSRGAKGSPGFGRRSCATGPPAR